MTIDEQTFRQILREELDNQLDTRFAAFELKFAEFYVQMVVLFDERLEEKIQPVSDKVDKTYNSLDSFTARMDDDDIERIIMDNDFQRHDRWIRKIAKKTTTTLPAS